MPVAARRILWTLAVIVVLAVAGVFVVKGLNAQSAGKTDVSQVTYDPGTDYGNAPSYTLTNQDGKQVSSAQLAGKVQVVSFQFPYCTTYCPMIMRTLVETQQRLADAGLGSKVRMVAFNVDPAGAKQAQMRAFLQQYGIDPSAQGWQFLTGTPDQVRKVVTDGFHVYYKKVTEAEIDAETAKQKADGTYTPLPEQPNPLAARNHVTYDVTHNDYIDIVGPHGKIVEVFNSGSKVEPATLASAVEDVLRGKTPPRQTQP